MRKKYSKALALALTLGLLLTPVSNAMAATNNYESTETTTAGGEEASDSATVYGAATSNPLTKINNLAVTPENLGIPGEAHYSTSTYQTAYYARNIWDMAAIDGKVLLSMGDYGSNTGAVPIYYYTNDSTAKKECTYESNISKIGLSSEEIKRFYNINGTIYATATDPLNYADGSYYKFDSATNKWIDYHKLPMSIHCYDMVEYNGEVFFAGMVRGSGDTVVNCVQKLNTSDLGSSKAASDIKFYYADGTEFKAEWDTYKLADGTTQTYFNSEYWRTYDMFVYKGELYVAHSSTTKYTVTPESGLFKYDKQNNRFVQVSKGTDTKGFMAVTRNMTSLGYVTGVSGRTELHYPFGQKTAKAGALTVGQEAIYSEPICGAKISTSDTFVAVCNGIFKSSDVITFEKVSLGAGYENYVTRDAFEKDGKYYFLASVKNGTNNFTTAVFETDKNFTTFRRVLYFNTPSFARSFVYNDGYIYIGLGGNGRIDNLGDSEGSPYSGTLYRINLAKLIPSSSEEKTETPSTSEVTTEEKTETPSTSEVTTEEKTETPSASKVTTEEKTSTTEVTTEEKTETPSTSEVTTEQKPELPSTSEVTTEEKPELPSTSEVTEEEKPELPSTSEETTEEEKPELPSTSEETTEEAGTPEKPEEGKQTGWVKVGTKWYYFNADGSKKTGWVKDGSKWYYLNTDGTMQTGWVKDGGKWYYLNANGTMQTGWVKDGGKWYYLNGNGLMHTGWIKVSGKWYYLNASGDMAQGWIKVATKWYYLGNSGDMLTGWLKQNNIWYYLSGNGDMLNGWQKIKGKWYYFYSSGKMASNTKIGSYYVNANGEWVK